MGERYHLSLNFKIRRDAPAGLHAALAALAERRLPGKADLATLPRFAARYLRRPVAPLGRDGDGFTCRYSRVDNDFPQESPGDATHYIHLEYAFHDDEYFNIGQDFIYWLFSFAAEDGHLAVELANFNQPPAIYTKHGDDLLVTTLDYHPPEGIGYTPIRLDAETPVVVRRSDRFNLKELVEALTRPEPDPQEPEGGVSAETARRLESMRNCRAPIPEEAVAGDGILLFEPRVAEPRVLGFYWVTPDPENPRRGTLSTWFTRPEHASNPEALERAAMTERHAAMVLTGGGGFDLILLERLGETCERGAS